MIDVFNNVAEERIKQDTKWGVQNHSPEAWMLILMEEVGEASKELLEYNFTFQSGISLTSYRKEMVQVAAVAIAAIECFDRNEAKETRK